MTRIRTRYTGTVEGFAQSTLGTPQSTNRNGTGYISQCRDEEGFHDYPLWIEHKYVTGGFVTTHYVPDPTHPEKYVDLKQFPLTAFDTPAGFTHHSMPDQPSNSFLAVKLIAATNPSKPVVNLPVAIGELKDLPMMLKREGDSILKKFAGRNLQQEFGLMPVLSDATKMMKVSQSIGERVKLFQQLRDKPQVRKANLYNGSMVTQPGTVSTTNSSPGYVFCRHRLVSQSTQVQIGGYVTWTGGHDFTKSNLSYTDPALKFLARRAVLGTNIDLSTLWELTPWSWLADWYGNLGDYLAGSRSVVPVYPSKPRLTIRTTSVRYYVAESTNFGFTPGSLPVSVTIKKKERVIASAALPSAFMPMLSLRQVGILASLGIMRS